MGTRSDGANSSRNSLANVWRPRLDKVEPEIKDNPAIYPTEDVKKNLFPDMQADPDLERLRTRTWTKIKTGQ
jgi:putrescine transport system substrate-binding protein